MLKSQDDELFEAGINLGRFVLRFSRSVIPEQLFDPKEMDAYEIIRRQGDLDIWHKLQALTDKAEETSTVNTKELKSELAQQISVKQRTQSEIDQEVIDSVLSFKTQFETKL